MADAPALADARHGWVWAVLPDRSAAVDVAGEDGLVAALREAGQRVGADRAGGSTQAVLATFRRWPAAAEMADLAERAAAAGYAAVAVIPEPVRRRSRPARALERLRSVPAAVVAAGRSRRVAGAFRRVGLHAVRAPIGRTAGGMALGGEAMFGRRGRPTGALVVAARGGTRATVLDSACGQAERTLGAALRRGPTTVLHTGAVMAELTAAGGRRYLLRVAGGHAAGLLWLSVENRRLLLDCEPPSSVRSRVPEPLGCGRAGPATWTLEPRVSGFAPARIGADEWTQALDFLVGLHATGRPGEDAPEWDLRREFRAIEPHVRPEDREILTRLERDAGAAIAGVPLGWGHGDFWTANLLFSADRLRAVVDWDSAAVGMPAGLDLMHLLLLADRRARRLSHGSRCTEVLLPLVQGGGDERLRRYCAEVGVPPEAAVLTGLALAYWVWRVGRDLRTYRDRPERPEWMEGNLHLPLRRLARLAP